MTEEGKGKAKKPSAPKKTRARKALAKGAARGGSETRKKTPAGKVAEPVMAGLPADSGLQSPEGVAPLADAFMDEPTRSGPVPLEEFDFDSDYADAAGDADVAKDESLDHDTMELVTFRAAGRQYAMDIDDVEEILRHRSITRVPRTNPYVLGITSLRGKIIPVMNIDTILTDGAGLHREFSAQAKILILKGDDGPVGVMVSKQLNIVPVSRERLLEPPNGMQGASARFVRAVFERDGEYVSVLDGEMISSYKATGEAPWAKS